MIARWQTKDGYSYLETSGDDNQVVLDENGVVIVECSDRLEAEAVISRVCGFIRYLVFRKNGERIMSDAESVMLKYICWVR